LRSITAAFGGVDTVAVTASHFALKHPIELTSSEFIVRMISNELYEGIPPVLFAARQGFAIYAGCETGNKAFEVLINAEG